MAMLAETVDIVIGVDTHKHTHTAAAVQAGTGAVVAEVTVPADPGGYDELVAFGQNCAGVRVWAIEGSGSYGAGLAAHLDAAGEAVIEVDRPKRPVRRNGAKSDSLDAVLAARETIAREHLAQPRARGQRQALSVLLVARRSAVDAATVAKQQIHALVTAAPEQLRARFRGVSTTEMINAAAALGTNSTWDVETTHTAASLKAIARRCKSLQAEADTHEKAIVAIVDRWRPDLLRVFGVGPIVAAVVLCAWSHPRRCRNEAAFANLAGVAPIPASSGLTVRHRVNRHGDRQLNQALQVVVLTRLRYDPTTRHYLERRTAEARTRRRSVAASSAT